MSYSSDDSSAQLQSETRSQGFSTHRRSYPAELEDFRRLYESLLPQAEAEGFGNVFSWVASRQSRPLQQTPQYSGRERSGSDTSEVALEPSVHRDEAARRPNENFIPVRGGGAGAPILRPPLARPVPPQPRMPPSRNAPSHPSTRPGPPQQMIGPPADQPPELTRGRVVLNPYADDPFVRPIILPNHDNIPRDPTLPPATTDPNEFYQQLDESLFTPIVIASIRNRYGRPGLPSTVAGTRFLIEECKDVLRTFYPDVHFEGKKKNTNTDTDTRTEEVWYRPATEDGQEIYGTTKGSSYADKRMAIQFGDEPELGINVNTTTMKKKTPEMILRESKSFDRLRHNLRAAGNEVAEWFMKYHPKEISEADYRRKARDKCKEIMQKYIGPPQRFAGSF